MNPNLQEKYLADDSPDRLRNSSENCDPGVDAAAAADDDDDDDDGDDDDDDDDDEQPGAPIVFGMHAVNLMF
ncbi:hypothetical protein CSKR_203173 [Clonorchis sinensis]|uniref:Uncharacterized protein n=1 Tax=Clonorchis sinensis TaxID=79923 RepID=A0A8T1M7N0_CLOSI|nr:hypothetical protein CSKR_203173 [Clonorchis sinensis]